MNSVDFCSPLVSRSLGKGVGCTLMDVLDAVGRCGGRGNCEEFLHLVKFWRLSIRNGI